MAKPAHQSRLKFTFVQTTDYIYCTKHNKTNSMSRQKVSYGLALCRYNSKKNNCIEILSIKKRFTYCYFSFIHGFYGNKNIRNDYRNFAYIKYLFDNMSFQEKLTILSMNYGNMWWHIWLNNPEKGIGMFDNISNKILMAEKNINLQNEADGKNYIAQSVNDYKIYFKKKNKFEKKFLHDGGRRLHEIINNSKNCDSIWEIPKGAKNSKETDLDTAIREFAEETLIAAENYSLLYHAKPVILTYKDNGVIYKHIYFLAELNEYGYANKQVMNPKLNFKSYSQLSEVADIRWLSTSYINMIDMNNKSKKNMLKLYRGVIERFKTHKC